jgi:hypothetical protein
VIEINQARAVAGGVTATDTAGFPVTLDAPGSYRLTGDLSLDTGSLSGIDIRASDVTLDLNGFGIIGTVVCTTSETETSCSPSNLGGMGVSAPSSGGYRNITVRNGTVRGMGNDGIDIAAVAGVRIEGIRAISNGARGISVREATTEDSASVTGCSAIRNGNDGIYSPNGSEVSRNVANYNDGMGISTLFGSIVSGNVAIGNFSDGIFANVGSLVTGNVAYDNTGYGLSGSASYANNSFVNNNGGSLNDQVDPGHVEIGVNRCGTDTTCP